MSNDILSDMITCICNANSKKAQSVQVQSTRLTVSIAKILLREGFIESLRERKENNKTFLIMTLKYQGKRGKPYASHMIRISKPGLRIYSGYMDVPIVLGGMGMVILSTSEGILTDREARHKKIGGEILCYIW